MFHAIWKAFLTVIVVCKLPIWRIIIILLYYNLPIWRTFDILFDSGLFTIFTIKRTLSFVTFLFYENFTNSNLNLISLGY